MLKIDLWSWYQSGSLEEHMVIDLSSPEAVRNYFTKYAEYCSPGVCHLANTKEILLKWRGRVPLEFVECDEFWREAFRKEEVKLQDPQTPEWPSSTDDSTAKSSGSQPSSKLAGASPSTATVKPELGKFFRQERQKRLWAANAAFEAGATVKPKLGNDFTRKDRRQIFQLGLWEAHADMEADLEGGLKSELEAVLQARKDPPKETCVPRPSMPPPRGDNQAAQHPPSPVQMKRSVEDDSARVSSKASKLQVLDDTYHSC
jgi:hypothetical protein